ncbi:MAG: primosomal protein N' [Clostridiaceae bacterium]|nr:primosomal protein N' [Clostridiaceae bacterium]
MVPVEGKQIAEVIVSNMSRNVDKHYHYRIPPSLREKAQIGKRVLVPFGNGNKKTEAFIMNLLDESNATGLKEIYEVVDETPLFDEKMLDIIYWMRDKYLCTCYEALKAVLPPGIGLKAQEWITLKADISDELLNTALQKDIIRILHENGGCIEYNQLVQLLGNSRIRSSVQSLQRKKIISIDKEYKPCTMDKTIRLAYLNIPYEEVQVTLDELKKKAPVQARMVEILAENDYVSLADLVAFSQGSYSAVNSLHKKGIINYKDQVVLRNPFASNSFNRTTAFEPTPEQKKVIELIKQKIQEEAHDTVLIRGVTGSGKTEVFLQVIEYVISKGKQGIVLVPEISLTPQMMERFMSRFGSRVAVLHSGLSIAERYDQWKRIQRAEVDVVVGARSAVFAPVPNLGIIILDEEHEHTYKSERAPRYHSREVACRRALNEKALVVLSSATPSLDSYYKAQKGDYILLHMDKRYNNAPLPETYIVDMREELINGNKSIFSNRLREEIEFNIKNKQQTILFINRRGFSTFVSCRNCGHVITCPYCNISLTYHVNTNHLMCHYCGYRMNNVRICPKCNSQYIRHFGIGTEKVEQEIKRIFPGVSVIRMDADTTGGKFSHEMLLNRFRDEKIDILVGTQMVSKGLDFPNVTLVGILAADMSLNIDDFRSAERTFQLITQVCGRAGRGDIKGRAVIQTYQPENFTIQLAKQQDYLSFYASEIKIREQLKYPPFSQIVSLLVHGMKEKEVITHINNVVKDFRKLIQINGYNNLCYEILGPTPAPVSKIKNRFRWRVLIKCSEDVRIMEVLKELLDDFYSNKKSEDISLTIDINPVNLM